MPDRAMRQFGYGQTIPLNPRQPMKQIRSANPRSYVVHHQVDSTQFQGWREHVCLLTHRSIRVDPGNAGKASEAYLAWYLPRTRPKLIRDSNRVACADEDGRHEVSFQLSMYSMEISILL